MFSKGYGKSITGKKRDPNEDSFLAGRSLALYIVGGHPFGELDSASTVRVVKARIANRTEAPLRLADSGMGFLNM